MNLHDNVIISNHCSRYLPFVRGSHRSQVNSPHKSRCREALMFSLICDWTNGWVNNRDPGDLRRYCAHYDTTVMNSLSLSVICSAHILFWPTRKCSKTMISTVLIENQCNITVRIVRASMCGWFYDSVRVILNSHMKHVFMSCAKLCSV